MTQVSRRLIAGTLATIFICGASIPSPAGQETDKTQLGGVAVPDTTLDLSVSQMPVVDFLRSVSPKATGDGAAILKIVASNDAEVERISVFTARMPLRETLTNVATLYGWDWSSERDSKSGAAGGADVLTLGPTKQRRAWERRRWNTMMDNALLPVSERLRADREKLVARERNARALFQATRDPKQRELKEREYLASKAATAASGLYSTLSRPQKRQLLEQEELHLTWAQLTSTQRDFAIGMIMPYQFRKSSFSGFSIMDETIPTKEERERFVNELVSRLRRTGVTSSVTLEPVTGIVLGLEEWGRTFVPAPSALQKFEEALPSVRGNPYTAAPDEETPAPQINASDTPSSAPTAGEDYTDLETIPFPDKLRFAPEDTWGQAISKVAQAVDKPIFSDGYTAARGIRPFRSLGLEGGPLLPLSLSATPHGSLASGLDELCRVYNMVWWRQNGALFFRSRTWLQERRYETPVTIRTQLLTDVRDLPSATRAPGRNAARLLQSLSPLSLQQLEGLAGTDKPGQEIPFLWSKGERLDNAVAFYKYLGFYNTLTAEQQLIAVSPGGFKAEAMTNAQRDALDEAVGPRFVGRALEKPERLAFTAEIARLPDLSRSRSERQASSARIRFQFTTDPETPPCHYAVAVSEEQQPAAPPPKTASQVAPQKRSP